MTTNEIEQLLRTHNVSVTSNRVKIIECLINDSHHFHTINEISNHTKSLNTKSIYNNIKTLIDAGIVDSYSFQGVSKFAFNDDLTSTGEIHIINKDDVSHLKINNKVFDDIKAQVQASGHKVKNIKIFVEIEK